MIHRNQSERACRGGPAPFLKRLRSSRGEFTLNGALELLLVMALLVLFISVLGVANRAMKLHDITAELVRYIELRGQVDSLVYDELDRLTAASGLTVEDCDINASYWSGTKIQFGSSFSVTLRATGRIGMGGILVIDIPLQQTVTGRSEQYWK